MSEAASKIDENVKISLYQQRAAALQQPELHCSIVLTFPLSNGLPVSESAAGSDCLTFFCGLWC